MLATTTIQLNPQLVALVGGVLIPLLVGVFTKINASPTVKVLVNLALSAIAGGIATISTTGTIANWQTWVMSMVAAFGSSILSYNGLWKPTGTSAAVQNSTRSFGFGRVLIELEGPASTPDPSAPPVVVNGQALTHVSDEGSGLAPAGRAESLSGTVKPDTEAKPAPTDGDLLRTAISALQALADREGSKSDG